MLNGADTRVGREGRAEAGWSAVGNGIKEDFSGIPVAKGTSTLLPKETGHGQSREWLCPSHCSFSVTRGRQAGLRRELTNGW